MKCGSSHGCTAVVDVTPEFKIRSSILYDCALASGYLPGNAFNF